MVAAMRMKFALSLALAHIHSGRLGKCSEWVGCAHTTNTVCSFAMPFEMVDARIPCTATQHINTTYTMPLEGFHAPSRAMTMTDRNIVANP